ncbi:hypothetical protein L1987_31115 [Smallanthus sonchifolius]|uniref:Uncharacterized protein n=1 Tax=Smallanthus sonchifolius TaxID=185202 RepID=A0ACB9I5X3_9ASTR|nr:hypothetical protein L1987_31115 [Smallanthus sonchifolius]
MASTISYSPSSRKTFDVLLSYYGQGSRDNFVDDVLYALERRGISTDMVDLSAAGSGMSRLSFESSERSSVAVIIFCKDYSTTPRCLDELVKIMKLSKAIEGGGLNVLPVFYYVDPLEIRNSDWTFQDIRRSRPRVWKKSAKLWRQAIVELINLQGLTLNLNSKLDWDGLEEEIAKTIIRNIGLSSFDVNIVELVKPHTKNARFLKVNSEVYSTSKSSMANSSKLHNFGWTHDVFMSFRGEDTRKNFVDHLRAALEGYEIYTFNDNETLDRGKSIAPELLRAIEESAISVIIFSKNYASSTWCLDELVKIMSCHRMSGHIVFPVFYDVSPSDVRKQEGHFGERFARNYNTDKMEIWREALVEAANLSGWDLKSFANGHEATLYGLQHLQKLLLEDVTKEENLRVRSVVDGKHMLIKRLGRKKILLVLDDVDALSQLEALAGSFRVLEQKSLITISNERLWMHDLIQEMGKDIVRRMQPNEHGWRSRLWDPYEIADVLKENTGKEEIKAIVVGDLHEVDSMNISEAFRNMEKLRLLYFHAMTKEMTLRGSEYLPNELRWLTWNHFNLDSLPESFHANKLVGLEMPRSKIKQLWDRKDVKVLHKLKFLDLSYSKLTKTPDFNQIPNLERLNLGFCLNLLEVHTSVGVLERLVYLSLSGCSNLKHLPESLGNLVCLTELNVSYCMIEELPHTIGNLYNLVQLNLSYCQNLTSLPNTITRLYNLETLDLHHCLNLEEFPENLDGLERLENLIASSIGVRRLPDAISRLKCLKTLDLHHCLSIEMPLNLSAVCSEIGIQQNLAYLNLSCCIQLEEFPESMGNLENLSKLDLSHNMIQELPSSIGNLTKLIRLNLTYCQNLRRLPATTA